MIRQPEMNITNLSEVMVLIKEADIKARVKQLAQEIVEDHRSSGNEHPPVMVCVLNGASIFFADLIREMNLDVQVDFVRAKSYVGKDNSGGVIFTKDMEMHIRGQRAYIIDDILDTGNTMLEVVLRVNEMLPEEVRVVALLQRENGPQRADFYGFEIGDDWAYGYGMDNNSLNRNLKDIHIV